MMLYVHFETSSSLMKTGSLIGLLGLGLAITAHANAKSYFYEVEIREGFLFLRGQSVNKPITVKLPISRTEIYLKSKGRGRSNNEYYIRFKHGKKSYDVNRLFNWNYLTLVDLFHEFKKQKGEKIIWDEKYLIEFMEKKSKRMFN